MDKITNEEIIKGERLIAVFDGWVRVETELPEIAAPVHFIKHVNLQEVCTGYFFKTEAMGEVLNWFTYRGLTVGASQVALWQPIKIPKPPIK